MVRLLPPRPSLEHLKQQAKDLIGAYRRGESEAQARLWRLFPLPAPTLRYCPARRPEATAPWTAPPGPD
jgi:hypothetical protein